MGTDKAKDDKHINKDEDYERNHILDQYDKQYHDDIKNMIENGDYQEHDELYKKLKKKGINPKK